MITDIARLLETLSNAGVRFIIVGGAAATAHGSARLTQGLDVVYARDDENRRRILAALAALSPYPRGAPEGLPFQWDQSTLSHGTNFTLRTSLGAIDLLGEITGGGGYDALLPSTVEANVYGVECRVLDLDRLIEVKRAAGRPKDFEAVAELELIRDRRREG